MKTIGKLTLMIAMVISSCTNNTVNEPKHMVEILKFKNLTDELVTSAGFGSRGLVTFEILSSYDSIKEEVNIVTYRKYNTSKGDMWLPSVLLDKSSNVGIIEPKRVSH